MARTILGSSLIKARTSDANIMRYHCVTKLMINSSGQIYGLITSYSKNLHIVIILKLYGDIKMGTSY